MDFFGSWMRVSWRHQEVSDGYQHNHGNQNRRQLDVRRRSGPYQHQRAKHINKNPKSQKFIKLPNNIFNMKISKENNYTKNKYRNTDYYK
ncbi:hypothetical protein AB1L30_00065, partial [Bremerella sp. JC817]|uniref:hypothetical protein n=1 Tax=Bremerella sp. JC817 TaxID=3231756 RepID=UPI00345903E6